VILSSAFLALVLVVSAVCITVSFNKALLDEDRKEQTTELFSYTTKTTEMSSNKSLSNFSNLWIISRDLWQALHPLKALPGNKPALLVVIKHTGGAGCTDIQTCSARVREIQKKDMEQYPDIRYNFLIGGDARIYEGRGWLVQNEGIRNESVDIAFIGDFNRDVPSELMLRKARSLVVRGQRIGEEKIKFTRFWVMAHNHTELTDSPGRNVYKLLKKDVFFHYSTEVCYSTVDGKVVPTDTCPPI